MFFLHDMADSLAFSLKVLVETNHYKLSIACWAGLMPVWIYTRIYVMGFHILPRAYALNSETGLDQLLALMTMLFVNHIYWTFNLLIVGVMAISDPTLDVKTLSLQVPPKELTCECVPASEKKLL